MQLPNSWRRRSRNRSKADEALVVSYPSPRPSLFQPTFLKWSTLERNQNNQPPMIPKHGRPNKCPREHGDGSGKIRPLRGVYWPTFPVWSLPDRRSQPERALYGDERLDAKRLPRIGPVSQAFSGVYNRGDQAAFYRERALYGNYKDRSLPRCGPAALGWGPQWWAAMPAEILPSPRPSPGRGEGE